MEKKEVREGKASSIDMQKLPVERKNKDENPEFIDDHVPGNHDAVKEDNNDAGNKKRKEGNEY